MSDHVEYLQMLESKAITAARDRELTGADLRVLFFVVGSRKPNLIATDVAKGLGMASSHVSRSIKKLIEKGYLEDTLQIWKHKYLNLW